MPGEVRFFGSPDNGGVQLISASMVDISEGLSVKKGTQVLV